MKRGITRLSRLTQLSGLAVLCFIFASAMYMMYLIYAQYQVREKLQQSYLERNLQENEKKAMAIGYFFSERLYDLATLAESRELAMYYENQALGMSVEYGLGATINAVEELLSHFRSTRQIGPQAIFARLAYADTSGKILFDSSDPRSFGKRSRHLAPQFPRSGSRAAFLCDKVGRDDFIVISAPFSFKGHAAGQLYGWIPFELVCRQFIEVSGGAGSQLNLLLFRGRYLFGAHDIKGFIPPSSLPDPALLKPGTDLSFSAPSSNRALQQIHALLTQVEHTPFGLVSLTRTGSESQGPPPRALLYIMAGIGLALLAGGSAFYRVSMRSLALEVRLDETRIRERIVEENNNHLRKLLTALEQSSNSVMISDGSGAVEYVNPHYCRVTGYDAAEIIGSDCWQVAETNQADRIWQEIRETVLGGSSWSGEFQSKRKSGELFWEQANISPVINEQGTVSGLIAIREDITGRKTAELELLRAKETAEAASRAKSAFLANMSHEIRTPMNGIIGMTELCLTTNIDSEQKNYLNAVKSSADNLLSIINDILDFSKIEAGKAELDTMPFLLSTTICQALQGLAVRAAEKGLEIIFNQSPDIPDALIGDPGRLRQILINLVDNAIKFSSTGQVLVDIQMVEEDENACLLSFSVRDAGIGIAPEKRDRIFAPFEQGDLSTTKAFGGTGLGLAISRNLVELMGGDIRMESELGAGSTFTFTARFAIQHEPQIVCTAQTLKGRTALVVDDIAINRDLLASFLDKWGVTVTLAENAAAALKALDESAQQANPFDFVLIDAQMPDCDGWQLVEEIRSQPVHDSLYCILMPSAGMRGDSRRCRKLRVDGYISKPILHAEVYDLLCLLVPSGSSSRQTENTPVTRFHVLESRQRLAILVAEDVPVNQVLIKTILARYGHAVTLVENGEEAVQAWQKAAGGYDLIFMDVQMPVMDGFLATRRIRERERNQGGHIPIIAMTAYAMTEDRERCLEAGMDGYISKPFEQKDIQSMLKRFFEIDATTQTIGSKAEMTATSEGSAELLVFDMEEFLVRIGGKNDMVPRLLAMFAKNAAGYLKALHQAMDKGDDEQARIQLHTIKGAAANISAHKIKATAATLEMMASEGQRDGMPVLVERLESEFREFNSLSLKSVTVADWTEPQ